jgi:predicted metal-dependent enzyme (double-stranded beta helix superfamily)
MQLNHNHPDPVLLGFVRRFGELLESGVGDEKLRVQGSALLAELVARDDWLAPEHAEPNPRAYRQNLLHLDPAGRFSVVAFVWGPGQETPIHDHTVWGLIGMLRGSEISQGYRFGGSHRLVEAGPPTVLLPGQVEAVGPRIGDIHRVRNAFADRTSISIHVYGGDIGAIARSTYSEDGSRRPFVSGYSPALHAAT